MPHDYFFLWRVYAPIHQPVRHKKWLPIRMKYGLFDRRQSHWI